MKALNWKPKTDPDLDPLNGCRKYTCDFCGLTIEGSPIFFRGRSFHPECFIEWWSE